MPLILKQGPLFVKKGRKSKRYAALCFPSDVTQVESIMSELFSQIPKEDSAKNQGMVNCYGHLSIAAALKAPVLLVLNQKMQPESTEFIHFQDLLTFTDEHELDSACYFQLNLVKRDIKFKCTSSMDYQDWLKAISIAYKMVTKPVTSVQIASMEPIEEESQQVKQVETKQIQVEKIPKHSINLMDILREE